MRLNEFDLNQQIAYHSELNPAAWAGKSLQPAVRYKLLLIAKRFIEYLEIENFRVLDIVLTGSMANYNWTEYSDFDIHVVTQYSDLQCDDLAEAFYQAKKKIWNDSHDIIIHGHEVELYVEDIDQPPVSAGVYSILDGKWLKKPGYVPPDVDDRAVKLKVQDLIKRIDHVLAAADSPDEVNRTVDKIYQMRKAGLADAGEFSTENLSFKILRNLGYLDKLRAAYNHLQDQELGL